VSYNWPFCLETDGSLRLDSVPGTLTIVVPFQLNVPIVNIQYILVVFGEVLYGVYY